LDATAQQVLFHRLMPIQKDVAVRFLSAHAQVGL
jgi:hypothetical protein